MTNNFKKVRRVLWIILLANIAVAILKIVIGSIIKSNSMTADGLHSLTDGSSNIVGLIGIQFASKPIDEDHPYGHGKFEMLAGLFIAAMLFFIGVKVIINTAYKILNPVVPDISIESIVILLFTLFINIIVSKYEYTKGIEYNSQILISDSMHTRSDIYVSSGVLVTLVCIKFGLPVIIDSIASFVVAGFILHAAYEIFIDNSGILVDKAVINTKEIENIVLSFEQVKDTHHIRSRGCGNDLYIDMHIMTEPEMSVKKSHELTHNIEERIKLEINRNAQVIAHLEPYN
ncbi:MAG: cation diffusion facilitator family transporter [Sedimentibacter sp.]